MEIGKYRLLKIAAATLIFIFAPMLNEASRDIYGLFKEIVISKLWAQPAIDKK